MKTKRARLRVIGRLMMFPTAWKGSPEDIIEIYLESVSEFEDGDVNAGYLLLMRGRVSSYTGPYCPSPPQLAHACRLAEAQRLEHDRRITCPHSSMLSPEVEKSAESKKRVCLYLETNDRRVLAR
jgi:hypothetical protein